MQRLDEEPWALPFRSDRGLDQSGDVGLFFGLPIQKDIFSIAYTT
jgi:hypothetical protein